jgi:hypothetical protein
VHRLAWTVADLRGADRPGVDELDVALRLRNGDPLLVGSFGGGGGGGGSGGGGPDRQVDR